MYNIKNLKTGKWLDEGEKEFETPKSIDWIGAVLIHNRHLANLEDYEVFMEKGFLGYKGYDDELTNDAAKLFEEGILPNNLSLRKTINAIQRHFRIGYKRAFDAAMCLNNRQLLKLDKDEQYYRDLEE